MSRPQFTAPERENILKAAKDATDRVYWLPEVGFVARVAALLSTRGAAIARDRLDGFFGGDYPVLTRLDRETLCLLDRRSTRQEGGKNKHFWGRLSRVGGAPKVAFKKTHQLELLASEHRAVIDDLVACSQPDAEFFAPTLKSSRSDFNAVTQVLLEKHMEAVSGGTYLDAGDLGFGSARAQDTRQQRYLGERLEVLRQIKVINVDEDGDVDDSPSDLESECDEEDLVPRSPRRRAASRRSPPTTPVKPPGAAAVSEPEPEQPPADRLATLATAEEEGLRLTLEAMYLGDGSKPSLGKLSATMSKRELQDFATAPTEEAMLFFQTLGTLLCKWHVDPAARHPTQYGATEAAQSIDELGELAHIALGKDWLSRLLYALMGGVDAHDGSKRQVDAALMSFVLAEVIKKVANPRRIKPLHSFVASMLDANSASQQVRQALEKLKIAQTRQGLQRTEDVQADHLAAEAAQLNFPPRAVAVQLYDNLGFLKKGKIPSYIQYTMRLWAVHTEDDLKTSGVLEQSFTPPEYEEKFSTAADFLPRETDFAVVHTQMRKQIDICLGMIADLTSMGKDLMDLQPEVKYGALEVPALASPTMTAVHEQGRQIVVSEPDTDCFPDVPKTHGQYDGVVIPDPWAKDLATNATVIDLMTECLAALHDRLEEEVKLQAADPEHEPSAWAKMNAVWMCSDGAPHYMVRCTIDDDYDTYRQICMFGGAFHFVLESFRMLHKWARAVWLHDAIKGFRNTIGKQEYFLSPSDWTQMGRETPEIIGGILFVAAEEATKAKQRQCTSAEVWDHALSRARAQPIVAFVLIYAILAQTIMLAIDSEHQGSHGFEQYRVAHRILPLIFAATNAFKYCRSTMDQHVEWECASDAQYVFTREFLFTKATAHGKRIWADRFVEWFQHDVRKFEGKMWAAGKANSIRRNVMNMPERLAARERAAGGSSYSDAEFAADDGEGASRSQVALTDVFLAIVKHVRSQKLFVPGAQLKGWTTLHSRKPQKMDPQCVQIVQIAEERLSTTANKYYLPLKVRVAKRPEESNGLYRSVPSLEADAHSRRHFSHVRKYGCNANEIETLKDGAEACLTADAIRKELLSLHVCLQSNVWAKALPTPTEIRRMTNKSQLAEALARARTLLTTPKDRGGGGVKFPQMPPAPECDWAVVGPQVLSHAFFCAAPTV